MAEGINDHILAVLPRLNRYALALTRDKDTADSLVNDTVIRMLRFQDKWESGTNFPAWCICIAHNEHITNSRKRRLDRLAVPIEKAENIGVEETATLRIMIAEVCHELDDLPEEVRRVIMMAVVDGMEYEEIAAVTGQPVGTVRSRISRGRDRLRDRLDRHKPKHIRGSHANSGINS